MKAYPQGLTNITANGATLNGTTFSWQVPVVQANGGVGLSLEGFPDPSVTSGPVVYAELCTYAGDSDSKECNMVNLTPVEDDEVKG